MGRIRISLAAALLAGCTIAEIGPETEPEPEPPRPPAEREHDARFHGLWIVEQPYHALYEATFYDFRPDGALVTGASIPADCSGHLAPHCVTGSVARCEPEEPGARCTSELTCVFGAEWYSLSDRRLVIVGACADGLARPIVIDLAPGAAGNAEPAGAGGELVSVGGDPAWSHDNWEWSFRKCPSSDPATCTTF